MRAFRYFLLFGVYGTAPFWVTFCWIYDKSFDGGIDYWAGAPWYLFLAAPVCLVSLGFATLAFFVYRRTKGGRGRKITYAAATLTVLTVGTASAVLVSYRASSSRAAAQIAADRSLGQAGGIFLSHHPEVIAAVPHMVNVGCYRPSSQPRTGPQEIDCTILQESPNPNLSAILSAVVLPGAAPDFVLKCVSPSVVKEGDSSTVGTLLPCSQPPQ